MSSRRSFLLGAGAVGGLILTGRPPATAVEEARTDGDGRVVAHGTALDPVRQTAESQALARALADPGSPDWRARGDQRRTYRFAEAQADVPYRVCVPPDWDGRSALPLVMFLHGAGADESTYLDQNGRQLVTLAARHGYLLVAPLGYQGAYGSFLRLPAVFGQQAEADRQMAARTPETERTNQLSEKDVINVLELVLTEYPVDRSAMFLTGHSMGSGGTWYLGGKYPDYWKAIAPMSGPFVQEQGYPWDNVRQKPILVTEGTRAQPSLAGSRALRDWLAANGFLSTYEEVDADHPGMVPLVLPTVFDFFDRAR